MRFDPFGGRLRSGRLVRRYKRFLADIDLGGADGVVTAHCPNPGSMRGLDAAGAECLLHHVDDPRRKLAWSWESVRVGGTWVGMNTMRANDVAAWAMRRVLVPGLPGDLPMRREVPLGERSRIDFVLGDPAAPPAVFVEVKNTTMAEGSTARFPDSVTARGARHMAELARASTAGHRAVVLFLVNRGDCKRFEVAADIDPGYAAALADAVRAGVEPIALAVAGGPAGWTVQGTLPVLAP